MKVGVLTSSRADFGIYLPLITKLENDPFFDMELIVFGSHLSDGYGKTISEILPYNFGKLKTIETPCENNSAKDVSRNIALTSSEFAEYWDSHEYDYVIALGDRYEMYAAVLAASPFNIPIIHLFAGETTLGAIDNMYRHSISLMSQILISSTEEYARRATDVNPEAEVYNYGALNLENYKTVPIYTSEEFLDIYGVDLTQPTILSTFHPETVAFQKNQEYIDELLDTFKSLHPKYQILITLPNADTMGKEIREKIMDFQTENPWLQVAESLGMRGYLSAMKHAAFLLGNTSSGFLEASFFPKWVINIGDRQKGRIISPNILNTPIKKSEILEKVDHIENNQMPLFENIYGKGDTADKIIELLKNKSHATELQ